MWFFKKTDKEAAGFSHVVFYAFIGVIAGIVMGLLFGFVIGALTELFGSGTDTEMFDAAIFLGMGSGAIIGSLLGGATALKK